MAYLYALLCAIFFAIIFIVKNLKKKIVVEPFYGYATEAKRIIELENEWIEMGQTGEKCFVTFESVYLKPSMIPSGRSFLSLSYNFPLFYLHFLLHCFCKIFPMVSMETKRLFGFPIKTLDEQWLEIGLYNEEINIRDGFRKKVRLFLEMVCLVLFSFITNYFIHNIYFLLIICLIIFISIFSAIVFYRKLYEKSGPVLFCFYEFITGDR